MRSKCETPTGFKTEINAPTRLLREKYGVSAGVVRRRKQENGAISKKDPMICDYRMWITCKPSDKANCYKCGWNPEEEKKIRAILHDGGIKAVRKYISKRDGECRAVE